MLFTNEQRRRIRLGEISGAVRAWRTPKVRPGKRYRFDNEHELAVSLVERITIADIGEEDCRASGFASRTQLLAELGKFAQNPLGDGLYRVRFGLERRQTTPAATRGEVDRLADRLRRLDDRSEQGPWTQETLALIAANPRLVSTKLAEQLGRERFALRADIRKLKNLGLTRSHEVGYEVTELGRQVLEALDRAARPASPEDRGS